MQLILFRQSGGTARHLSVGVPAVISCLALLVVCIAGAAALGYRMGGGSNARPLADLGLLRQEVAGQQSELERLRRQAREQVDALTLRLGELNANVIRLNALGRRLTDMAELPDGEFNFDIAPALGGPEESTLIAGSGSIPDLMADVSSLDRVLFDQEQTLVALESQLLNKKLRQRVYPAGRPVRAGYISSYYGKRADPFTGKQTHHRGIDFAGRRGSPVISVAGGVVTWSGDRYGYGQMIEINHGNGYVTRYAHNDQNLVAVGESVQPGQLIALMGSTGRATGPNLHFEVWYRGRPADPVKYIRQTI